MATLDLPLIDRSVQETGTWIDDIAGQTDTDRQHAYHALRGVMFAVRDRVPIEENFHLASQMPTFLRGVYFEGYRPAHKPETYRDPEEFLRRIQVELDNAGGGDARQAACAVIRVLARKITAGEVEQVLHALPAEIRGVFS